MSPRLLAYLVVLCSERGCPKQNTIARLQPKHCSGYATASDVVLSESLLGGCQLKWSAYLMKGNCERSLWSQIQEQCSQLVPCICVGAGNFWGCDGFLPEFPLTCQKKFWALLVRIFSHKDRIGRHLKLKHVGRHFFKSKDVGRHFFKSKDVGGHFCSYF